MKKSAYNTFIETNHSEGFFAYNALSNSLCVLDKQVVATIQSDNIDTKTLSPELIAELKQGFFIADDHFDEIQYLKHRQRESQYSNTNLSLTIAPTINCNLACPYCFENHVKGKMSLEIIGATLTFVTALTEQRKITSLNVTWYGGEPLLYPGLIDSLASGFQDICKTKGITYSSIIITNGTKYTPETAIMLKQRGVKQVQITLDGDKITHDCRRVDKGGGGSFDLILKNIRASIGILPISIRINIDKSNAFIANQLVEHFIDQTWYNDTQIKFYLGHVRIFSLSELHRESVLSPEEFHQANEIFKTTIRAAHEFPTPNGGCVATNINGFVIGPNGDLWKCWTTIGKKEEAFGNVSDYFSPNGHFLEYMGESWENDEECLECKALPICMGGCSDVRIHRNKGMIDHKDCGVWRFKLHEKITHFVNHIQETQTIQPEPLEDQSQRRYSPQHEHEQVPPFILEV